MGLPPEIIASLVADEPEGFGVWPRNMAVVDAWLVVCTQWRATSLADGRVLWHGLDYAGVAPGLAAADIKLSRTDWAGLRLMERVAAATLNGERG